MILLHQTLAQEPGRLPEEKAAEESPIVAETMGGKIAALSAWDPPLLTKDQWPEIPPPKVFNLNFEIPTHVWRAPGGNFASFDRGEFGGALFFATENAGSWTKVLDGHVQDIGRFSNSSFLVVGGIAHLDTLEGSVYLLRQRANGTWQSTRVFQCAWGIPKLIGETFSQPSDEPSRQKLLVISIHDPMLQTSPVIGFDATGAAHYLGYVGKKGNENLYPSRQPRPGEPEPSGKQ